MRTDRPAARPDDIRRHNLAVILAQIHRDGPLTRAELTARLGLSRSTIGALVSDLTALGFVEESVPNGGDRAGRPSHLVGPHARGPFVVAVDVDVAHLTAAAVGIGGTTLARRTIAHEDCPPVPAQVARQIFTAVESLCTELGVTDADAGPAAIGVSVPGTVDRRTGWVGFAPNLGWRDAEFGGLLDEIAVPVVVGNDADLAVLAEHQRGSGRDCDDVVYLIGRVGVGAGIIANGAPLRGYDGHAGEIGHNVVDASGPPCHCGKNGCLETFVGDNALLELAGRGGAGTDGAAQQVFADARAGDDEALSAVRVVAEALGQALAVLVNTLNPQRVILGGSLADVLEIAREDVELSLDRHAMAAHGQTVQLFLPSLGRDSALLGAAEVAFAAVLDDPLRDRVLLPR
jgi:predicted NBD/HSP70 family sugar kinase/biotin operon repressor